MQLQKNKKNKNNKATMTNNNNNHQCTTPIEIAVLPDSESKKTKNILYCK